jgi:putative hemolysin
MLLIIGLMLLFNAFFAAYEMALAAVSKARLTALTEGKQAGAKEALFMKDHMEASLAVIQLGITLVGAIAAATGGASADETFTPYLMQRFGLSKSVADFFAIAFVIVPLSAVTIVLGELVPKTFALGNKEWVCLRFSRIMRGLYIVFYPVVYVLERVVKRIMSVGSRNLKRSGDFPEGSHIHEIKAAASMARASKLIGAGQERILHSAAELSARPVKNILIPAAHISMIPVSFSLADALARAHLDMHTRFPVCGVDGDPQTIMGYVNFKDILFALNLNAGDPTLKGIMRSIKSVTADSKNSTILEEMIRESAHIAVVRDASGKILGLVTMEDLLEELVGEIQDEYDRLPTYIHPYLGGWIMGGGVPMNTLASTVGISKSFSQGTRVPTLSEWCRMLKGELLHGGESVAFDGLTVVVRKLRRQQVAEALVTMSSGH